MLLFVFFSTESMDRGYWKEGGFVWSKRGRILAPEKFYQRGSFGCRRRFVYTFRTIN
jgi:hypothetical protein